jgi:cytochrome c551/c552
MTLALAALALSGPLQAEDVLLKHKCNTCHDAKAKKMGPTYKELAAKITEADVKHALEKGVKGKWGKAAMPPQPKAVADTAALTKAILAHK